MQTTYCTHCGSKNIYSGEKPKFCSSCGKPINQSTSPAPKNIAKKMQKREERAAVKDDDSTDIDYVPNINSLAYDLDISDGLGYQSYNMRDLINVREAEKSSPQEKRSRDK